MTYEWMEWNSLKHGTTIAHAVDPHSLKKTGVLRSINGSVIPKHAERAKSSTPKDPFCLQILAARTKAPSKKDGVYVDGVYVGGRMVRRGNLTPGELRVTPRSWGVYLAGKRTAFGRV